MCALYELFLGNINNYKEENKMKKPIALFLSVAMVLSVLIGGAGLTVSADAPTGDDLISFAGKTLPGDFGWTEWTVGSLSLSQRNTNPAIEVTLSGNTANPAIYLDTTGKNMNQKEYIQFHIVGPGTTHPTDNTMSIRILLNEGWGNGNCWEMSNATALFELKADDQSEWTPVTGNRELWIDKNFSGYIRLPLSRFNTLNDVAADNANFDRNQIKELKMWTNTWGNATTSSFLLDSFTTEKTVVAPAGNSIINFDVPELWQLGWLQYADANAVFSKTTRDGGINTLKFFTPVNGSASGGVFTVFNTLGQNMNDKEYITFHVTGPKQGMPGSGAAFTLNSQLVTRVGGTQQFWSMSGQGYYYIKNDGDSAWTKIDPANGVSLWLNNNFSGYVRLCLSNYVNKDSVSVGNEALDRNDICEMVNWVGNLDTTANNALYFDNFTTEITNYPIASANKSLFSFEDKAIEQLAYAKWGVGSVEIGQRGGQPTIKVSGDGADGNVNPAFLLDTAGKDLSTSRCLQFHFEGPKTALTGSTMWLRTLLRTTRPDGGIEYWEMTNDVAYYMIKDDATGVCESYPWGNVLWLDKNFSGYIQVPLDRFNLRRVGEEGEWLPVANTELDRNEISEVLFYVGNAGGTGCINSYVNFDSFSVDSAQISVDGADGFIYDMNVEEYDPVAVQYGARTVSVETNFFSRDYRKVVMTDSGGNVINGQFTLGKYTGLDETVYITATSVNNETTVYALRLARDAIVLGDADADGSLAAGDLIAIRKYLLDLAALTEKGFIGADLSEDDAVTITDLIKLKKELSN